MNNRWNQLFGRFEARALLTGCAIAGTLWAFLFLGSEIGEGETTAIDKRLISFLRVAGHPDQALGPPWFTDAIRDVTALGGLIFLVLFTGVFTLALIFHRRGREAAVLVTTGLAAQGSTEILKVLYHRARPDFMAIHIYSASFPSGHTTESSAIFLTAATIVATLESRNHTKILAYAVAGFVMLAVGDLLPVMPPFIGRVCSGYAPGWGVLQTPSV